ncbi:22140_t:CDS:10 [Rhizophagus irregularis]|nr:22140_t:CDS:10 [Rhizophagus irregularis]
MFQIIILAFLAYLVWRILRFFKNLKVPEGIKNIPTFSYLDLLFHIFTKGGPDKRWEYTRRALEKDGIGRFWFNKEWVLLVTDLDLAKDIVTKSEESFPGSLLSKFYGTNVVMSNGDLLTVMEKFDNQPIEVKNLMHRLTLDVLGKAAFGFDFNNLEDPENVYVTAYNEVIEELSKPLYLLLPFLNYFPRFEARKKLAKLNNLYDGIVENKRKSMQLGELDEKINNNSADLLEYMINACNDPENQTLTNEELRDAQSKVREEILRVLGDDLTPSMEQQKELKYMNMVINENLRLYPPIAQLPRRYPIHDVRFRDYNERHNNYSWLSFGGGNRSCLGTNFSLIEQRIILCALLRKYEVSLPADSIHKKKLQIDHANSGTMGPHPIPLIFKRRTE